MSEVDHEAVRAYEARIAALEAKLKAIESQFVSREAGASFDFTTTAEKFGLLAAWAVLIIGFGLVTPTMFTWPPYASMLGFNSIIVVLTLALILPLTAGDFDLSVASTLTLSAMIVAILNVRNGVPIPVAVAVAVALGAVIGAVNAFFILYFRIHSLIVTLGVGYFVNGVVLWASSSAVVFGQSLTPLVNVVFATKLLGVSLLFWYALILTIGLWYLFEFTATGRRLLFVGRGREVARLSGVKVERVRAGALIASGRHRRVRGRPLRRHARLRRPEFRAGLPAARLRCGLSRLDGDLSRPLQSLGGVRRGFLSVDRNPRAQFSRRRQLRPELCSTAAGWSSRFRSRNSCASARRWTDRSPSPQGFLGGGRGLK